MTSSSDPVRDLIAKLQLPLPDIQGVTALLAGPLDCLKLAPPSLKKYNILPLPDGSISVWKHVPLLQQALIQHILPAWSEELSRRGLQELVDLYFCPKYSPSSSVAGEVALHAYATLLSLPIDQYSIHILTLLCKEWTIGTVHEAVICTQELDVVKQEGVWEDCIRNMCALPAKIANSLATRALKIPVELENDAYFGRMCVGLENRLYALSSGGSTGALMPPINYPSILTSV
jgi:telomere length regulation protein